MAIRALKENVPNYAARDASEDLSAIQSYYLVGSVLGTVVEPIVSPRKLNHSVSNLPDATGKFGHMSHDEVVRRTQLGEFGSTEVPLKQVWYQ